MMRLFAALLLLPGLAHGFQHPPAQFHGKLSTLSPRVAQNPANSNARISHTHSHTPKHANKEGATVVVQGWLDNLFGGGGNAEASHILLKAPNADKKLTEIRDTIYNQALKGGDPAQGVSADKLMSAFAQQARKISQCPSGKQGGSLGSFGRGQMVPEFDRVVFNEPVGVIHGPIKTQFGSHLILITDRD